MKHLLLILLVVTSTCAICQTKFDGLDMSLSNLSRLSDAKTRSISAENFTGAKGKGGMADPRLDTGKTNAATPGTPRRTSAKGGR